MARVSRETLPGIGVGAAAAALLCIALVFGGGGSPAPLAELIVQLAALAILAWALLVKAGPSLSLGAVFARDRLIALSFLLLLAIMAVHLLPLPPSLWSALPGRAGLTENLIATRHSGWVVFSIAPDRTINTILALVPPVVAYMLASATRPEERRWLVPLLLIFAVATVVLQVIQISGSLFPYGSPEKGVTSGFQANRNSQADVLAIILCVVALRPNWGSKFASFQAQQALLALVLVIAVFLTRSRAGMAMMILPVGIMAVRAFLEAPRQWRMQVALAVLAVIILSLVGLVLMPDRGVIGSAFGRFSVGYAGRTVYIWPDAIYTMKQFVPWGSGFGTFVPAFQINESLEILTQRYANRAHDEPLEILIEAGIPGAVAVLFGCVAIFWRGFSAIRGDNPAYRKRRGGILLAAALLIFVHSLVDYPLRSLSIAVLFATIVGLVVADRNDQMDAKTAEPNDEATDASAGRTRAVHLVGVIASSALLVLLTTGTVVMAFDRTYRQLPFGISCSLPTPHSCVEALTREADAEGEKFNPAKSERLARAWPNDKVAQSFHGSVLAKRNDLDGAAVYFANSARLGWREPAAQVFAYQDAMSHGEFGRAVLHLGAIFETEPDLINEEALTEPLLASTDLRSAFAAQLAGNVTYQDAFLRHLLNPKLDNWEERVDLLDLAVANGMKLGKPQASTLVWQVFRDDPQKAADVWISLEGLGRWKDGNPVWTGDVRNWPVRDQYTPFAWFATGRNSGLLEFSSGKGRPTLAMKRSAGLPAMRLASVAMLLQPGRYAMKWHASPGAARLYPQLGCASNGTVQIEHMETLGGGYMYAEVTVPENCGLPMLNIYKSSGKIAKGAVLDELTIGGVDVLP